MHQPNCRGSESKILVAFIEGRRGQGSEVLFPLRHVQDTMSIVYWETNAPTDTAEAAVSLCDGPPRI